MPDHRVLLEPLNMGLITARDPATLQEGELQRMLNFIYRPNSNAAWRAPGRIRYNSSAISANPIKGLRPLNFDSTVGGGALNFLIAHVLSAYHISALSATTGSFGVISSISSVGAGSTLNSVYYRDKYYLFNGNADAVANKVVLISAGAITSRNHGMTPVTSNVTLAAATSAGWPSTSDFGNGHYFIFVTEVQNPDTPDELESTYQGEPPSIQITGTVDGITVTLPSVVNSSASIFRVYMVGPKDTNEWSDIYLAEAQVVVSPSTSQTSVTLGGSSESSATSLPTVATSSTWTNPNNAKLQNGSYATTDASTASNILTLDTFGFATGGFGTIQGIEVEIVGKISGIALRRLLNVSLGYTAKGAPFVPTTPRKPFLFPYPFSNKLGSKSDLWGRSSWVASEFSDANFIVKLEVDDTSGTTFEDSSTTISIDVVRVTVYHASASHVTKTGKFFPITQVNVGPVLVVVGANGPPPISSTGDVYEGQLAANDVNAPRSIKYSLPDAPDYFPSVYAQEFPQEVTNIKRIHSKLIIGTTNGLIRMNFLPRSEDAQFDQGRSWEWISEEFGIVGAQAAATFTPAGGTQRLAFVSYNGINQTDGLNTNSLVEDIDWSNTVNVDRLHLCQLVNNPQLQSLIFYYIPSGDDASSYPTRALYLSYHAGHIRQNGKLKVSGPVTVTASSSAIGEISGVPTHFTGYTDGRIYTEDQGYQDTYPDTPIALPQSELVTREIFPAGHGNKDRISRLWIRHFTSNPGVEVEVIPYVKNSNKEVATPSEGGVWTARKFVTNVDSTIPGDNDQLVNFGALSSVLIGALCESIAIRLILFDISGQDSDRAAIEFMSLEAVSPSEV